MTERYGSVLTLSALGDKIGYRGGVWGFNYEMGTDSKIKITRYTLSLLEDLIGDFVSEFIALGGVTGIQIANWGYSDNTHYILTLFDSLIDGKDVKKQLTSATKKYIADGKLILRDQAYLDLNGSDESSGQGHGAAIRAVPIGMLYWGKKRRKELIKVAIQTSKLTHSSPMGYLGGLVTALFVALGLEGVELHRWPYKLIQILESDEVKQYLDRDDQDLYYDYILFIRYWKRYVETRFQDSKPLDSPVFKNLYYRLGYFYKNFAKDIPLSGRTETKHLIGFNGMSVGIIAYDCLLTCNGSWEALIYYAMLNPGASDAFGSLAGAWYGAAHGNENVPQQLLDQVGMDQEFSDRIKKIKEK